ncbi:MAG: Gldg family protein [Candidatus Cloacimonadaceae bacterium]|nr:Gldg family protein [Candidatus Cloacimonadaceae bacterium]MDP3114506.1 Gldg family protein [Candidatus Cloacimonadaceae bacterium]
MAAIQSKQILSGYLIKIAIVVMLLVVGSYLYLRIDISKGKAYSIGSHSRETVSSLKDNMVVKIYASKELPGGFGNLNRYLKDILADYKRAGGGKFQYEYVKTVSQDELREEAMKNRVQPIAYQMYENDQIVTKEVIFGVVFELMGKFEVLQLFPGMEAKLEYEITKRIQHLDGNLLPEIIVAQDSLYKYYPTRIFGSELNANYLTRVTELDSIPSNKEVMLFTGTTESLSQTRLYNLDQFLMRGGKLVMLQDRVDSNERAAFTFDSNLFSLLEHYGILIHPNLVLDRVCDERRGRGMGQSIPYPIYPVVRGGDKSKITKNMDNIVLYLASEIALLDSVNLKMEKILQTSANSGTMLGPVFEVESIIFAPQGAAFLNQPPKTVGAHFKGKLTSYFSKNPELWAKDHINATDKAEIIIFSDRELFMDPDKAEYMDRSFIVLNAIDHFLNRDSMIKIRSRNLQTSILSIPLYMSQLKDLPAEPAAAEQSIKLAFRLIGIILPSLMLIVLGLVVFLIHRARDLR